MTAPATGSSETTSSTSVVTIPNLDPFQVEPLILARLNRRDTSPLAVAIVSALTTVIGLTYAASLTQSLNRVQGQASWYGELWEFVNRRHAPHSMVAMPLLRDYPSILLALTISGSVPLLYGLLRNLAQLHSDLDESGCVSADEDGRLELANSVRELNGKFAKIGRFAPVAVVVITGLLVVLNFRLKGRLEPFLGTNDLYADWWARLAPVRAGGIAWVAMGAIGTYMVYCEAVVGILYVALLRRMRSRYRFRANPLNPDGFYGWSRLRKIVTNMEAGVVGSSVTCLASFFLLQPAIGVVPTLAFISLFLGTVLYVFFSSMSNLRRQVTEDKRYERGKLIAALGTDIVPADYRQAVVHATLLRRLQLTESVPAMPIRKGVLVAGLLPLLAALIGLSVQLIKYFG